MSEASDDTSIQTTRTTVGDMTFEGVYDPDKDIFRVKRIDPPPISDERLVHVQFDAEGRLAEVVQFKVKESGLSIDGMPSRLAREADAAAPPPGPGLDEQVAEARKKSAGQHDAVMGALQQQPLMPPKPQY